MPKEKDDSLAAFKSEIIKILPLPVNQKSFLEILKISKREVPIANLLAYFFKPNETHHLGDLFIRSLLGTVCYDLKENKPVNELHLNGYLFRENMLASHRQFSLCDLTDISNVKVHTEKKTGEQKRIDIVIEAKEFIIAIEFKINHVLDNPLDIYEKHILETYCKKDTKPLFFVILTPWPKPHENRLIKNESFRQITLSSFVDQIKLNLPNEIKRKIENREYDVFYLMDFIRTVDNRKRNHELMEKLRNHPQILDLYDKLIVKSSLKELTGKEDEQTKNAILALRNIDEEIEKKLKSVKRGLKQGEILPKHNCFKGCLVVKIQNTECALKVRLSIKGWMLELWGKVDGRIGYHKFIKNLYDEEINFETSSSSIIMKINQNISTFNNAMNVLQIAKE